MPKTYSVKETAKLLGFSTNTIYGFLNSKKLQGIRIGKGRFRILQSEIDRMTGHSSAYSQMPVLVEAPIQKFTSAIVKNSPSWLNTNVSLTDWYIGLGSIIFGGSMFLFSTALEHVAGPSFVTWYSIVRLLCILLGVGFIVSKLLTRIPPIWSVIYHGSLIVTFGWFTVLSQFVRDFQGVVVGCMVCFVLLVQLFFAPTYHSKIALTTLCVAVMNTVLYVFFPQIFHSVLSSFGFDPSSGMLRDVIIVSLPYIAYFLLVTTHRMALRLYYVFVIVGSLVCLYGGYLSGVNLHPRQGLALLFTGVMLFLYVTWQTDAMKACKKTWVTGAVLGYIMLLFLAIISSLRAFEIIMYTYASHGLQIKVENGKTYLETIFIYAKNSFSIHAMEQQFVRELQAKDRVALTTHAKAMYERFPHMSRVVILDNEGTELANYPEDPSIVGRNYAHRAYFQDALTTGQTVFSDVIQSTETVKRYTIVIATPVIVDGVVYGVVAAPFDMDEIGRILQSFVADNEGEYFGVLDQKGVRIMNPNKQIIGTAITSEELKRFDDIPYWKTHLDMRTNPGGELVLATYRTVDFVNLRISAVEPYKVNLRSSLVTLLVTGIIGVYGYGTILITWYICYKTYKTVEKR